MFAFDTISARILLVSAHNSLVVHRKRSMSSCPLPSFILEPRPATLRAPQLDKLLLSPSGRYALQLEEVEIEQDPRKEKKTHYYRQEFTILDFYGHQWSEYTSLVGPLHRTRLYYWLDDDALVIVTFSRHYATLEQNLIMIDHSRRLVDNRLTRRYQWDVDNIMGAHQTNVTPLLLFGQEYLPVYGEHDQIHNGYLMYAIPYRLSRSVAVIQPIEIPEKAIIRRFVPSSQPTAYPFTLGSKILFRYSSYLTDLQTVNSFIALDVEKFLSEAQGDYVAPSVAALEKLRVHFPIGFGLPMSISSHNSMDNTASHRHVYYVRFTTSCFLVDFEKNRCEWIHPDRADQQYCGLILMHPTDLLLNVENGKKNEIIVRSFGRTRMRVPRLEEIARAVVMEQSTTTTTTMAVDQSMSDNSTGDNKKNRDNYHHC